MGWRTKIFFTLIEFMIFWTLVVTTPSPRQPDPPQRKAPPTKKSRKSSTFNELDAVITSNSTSTDRKRNHNTNSGGKLTAAKQAKLSQIKNFDWLVIGKFQIKTWYFSPYPEILTKSGTIYLCEFCLAFFNSPERLNRHMDKCKLYSPPGNEIYRCPDQQLCFFEIDGRKNIAFAQNLGLVSKCFLDHKNLYYDTEPFLYYILTIYDDDGHHVVGYFSKEKESASDYNVACILTLPCYQKQGYGRLLIEFSYLLTKKEGKLGSPEKPLSDLGLLSYQSYWETEIMELIQKTYESNKEETDEDSKKSLSINEICETTAIKKDDVVQTLMNMGMINYYKFQNIICFTPEMVNNFEKAKGKIRRRINPDLLRWVPKDWSNRSIK